MPTRVLMMSAILAACAGCSTEPALEEDASVGSSARFGLVSVTYGHSWAETGDGMLLSTAAQFVRYTDLSREQVGRILALPLDPERDLPPADTCRTYDLSIDLSGVGTEPEDTGSVELLEAGDLQLETAGRSVTLAPKHFPGLLPFVSGVVYSEAESTLVQTADGVRATSAGGESVGRFTVEASSPALPRLQQVGSSAPSSRMLLARDRDLALRWDADPKSAPGDDTYVELRYSKGKRDLALRCRARDDGSFQVPQAMLADVTGRAVLEISRLRRTYFSASGMEQGELRLTVRDAVSFE